MHRWRYPCLLCAVWAAGCFLDRAPIGGQLPGADAGPRADAGARDARADDDATIRRDAGRDAGRDAAGPEDDAGPFDAGCAPAGTVCAGGQETTCAADGSRSMRACDYGCAALGDRCLRVVPSNVPSSFVSSSAPPLVLSGTYDTGACPGGSMVAQSGGPSLCVVSASTVSVPSDLDVSGAHPLVIIASGGVSIDGDIDLSARGTAPGPGGDTGGVRSAPDGTGRSPGLRGGASTTNNADGGGGGGGLCGAGGRGGTGQAILGGLGGAAITGWELSPLEGGSGGGWARGASGTPDTSADGGAGGGAIQIFSSVGITLNGRIVTGGGGGRAGLRHPNPSTNYGAGGGGGSGGAVLLEAPSIVFGASARIFATGGAGGGSASDGDDGDPGQDGADASGRATGGARGGSNYGARGGDSGADDTPDGLNGASNTNTYANGGGGGGGAGCILLRTSDGAVPSGTGSFSPRVPDALSARTLRLE